MPPENQNQRDENGWRIPKEGTKSHHIYLMVKEGKKALEIAKRMKMHTNTVYVLIHKFKNPEYSNRKSHGQ